MLDTKGKVSCRLEAPCEQSNSVRTHIATLSFPLADIVLWDINFGLGEGNEASVLTEERVGYLGQVSADSTFEALKSHDHGPCFCVAQVKKPYDNYSMFSMLARWPIWVKVSSFDCCTSCIS